MSADPPTWVLAHRRRIGDRIRELRAERGLSQERLAEMAGVSRYSVYRAENATHATSIDHLIQIADALGVDLAVLVTTS
ncbi:helix-turn-helix transcriptional regulator [Streptomyces kronopolitis]|uniref:helix-turn-helix domain-containing protein n=1 Tax=Streptomyces kronopolitis TaxID=1612435 RepID=UPI00343B6E30